MFGDGNGLTESNPNNHVTEYTYKDSGEYTPHLIVKFSDDRMTRTSTESIMVDQ